MAAMLLDRSTLRVTQAGRCGCCKNSEAEVMHGRNVFCSNL
jgi:hypothetical protein